MSLNREFQILQSLVDQKEFSKGLEVSLKLCERFPTIPSVNYGVAMCLLELGRSEEAVIHLEIGIHYFKLRPDYTEEDLGLFLGLATMLTRTGQITNVKKFIEDNHQKIRWEKHSVRLLTDLHQLCLVIEAPELCLEVINEAFPSYNESDQIIDVLMLLANAAHAADIRELEFEAYTRALELDPLNPKIHNRVSRFLGRIKEWDAAADHIKFLKTLNPDFETASIAQDFYNLSKSGSFSEQEALKQKWLNGPSTEQESRAPFAALLATDDGAFLLQEAEAFASWTTLIINKPKRTSREPTPRKTSNKIRVGYVSPDFRNHAVCHLIKDLIKTHNRDQFEIFGYGVSMYDQSEDREEITSNFDRFYSLEKSATPEIIKQIHEDALDIVVDLAGYTQGFIQTLFNRINGPIIVNYLGYPGTTGHPQYDYIIGDPIVTPEEYDKFYSEKVVRLDCCYQSNSPSRKVSDFQFERTGLPADTFVFCNFNTRQKINREALLSWEKIVKGCPDSVLWLLDPGKEMQTEVLKVLKSIESRVFFAPQAEISEHLGRVEHANLFLDSFPYGAHTTASDAVFRGVPILARSGQGFQSRVSRSIIHHAGLEDLYATSWDEFKRKAVDFYQSYTDSSKSEIRKILVDRARDRHPYNIEWTTAQIEKAYSDMLGA